MNPEIHAQFAISADKLDPEEITILLGVTPTRTWKKGDLVKKTKRVHKENGWLLEVPAEKYDLKVTAKEIIAILMPKREVIAHLVDDGKIFCELHFGVYVSDEPPTIYFEPSTLHALASLNTFLDVDLLLIGE